MKYTAHLALLCLCLTGCSALREQTGQYVTEAVVEKISSEVDKKLAARNTSVQEIKAVVDSNKDGKVLPAEVISLVKDMVKDYATLESKKLIDEKIVALQDKVVSKGDLESKSKELWNYVVMTVLGLISTYLGKQIMSAKSDSSRDNRIALLEQLMQKDIDGDGTIGNRNGNADPTKV